MHRSPHDDLESLVAACRAGDPCAWRNLFEQRIDRIYRWAVLLGSAPHEAQDVAQDVLATCARRIEACPSAAALDAWLFQITRRVAANARRRHIWRRWLRSTDDREAAFEHACPADLEHELCVRSCLERLGARHVEVLVLMEIEGHTRDETAQLLGIPPGTVASRLRLARDAFRACWEARFGPSQRAGASIPPGAWLSAGGHR